VVGATPGAVVAPGTGPVVPAGSPIPGEVMAPGTGEVVAAGGPVPTPGTVVAPGTGPVIPAGGPTPGAVVAPGTGAVVTAGGPTPGAVVAPGTGAIVPAAVVVTVKYHHTDTVRTYEGRSKRFATGCDEQRTQCKVFVIIQHGHIRYT